MRIAEKKQVADKVMKITLALDGADFDYRPGQYVRVTVPELKYPDPRGPGRDFSISCVPNGKAITITFRACNEPSGFKKTLLSYDVGEHVLVSGPHGDMLLPPADSNRPLVFIAGGIGITAFRAKIKYALENAHAQYHMTLLWSGTSERNIPYLWELRNLAEEHRDRFHLVELFGQRITGDILKKHMQHDGMQPLWQIAGPTAMVRVMCQELAYLGISEGDVSSEEYAGYEAPIHSQPAKYPIGDINYLADVTSKNIPLYTGLLEALNKTAIVSKTDMDGIITFVNDKFVEVSGYSRAELIGQNHRLIKSGAHSSAYYQELWHTIVAGGTWRGEIKNRAKDGTYYWVDTSIAPVFDENGVPNGYVSVRFLITDRKEAEEKLAAYRNGLEEIVKERTRAVTDSNEALKAEVAQREELEQTLRAHMLELAESDKKKDEFIAILSHELRNPLSQILTTAEIARLSMPVQCPILGGYLGTIERQSYAMKHLLDDLLDVSRIMRGKITLRRELIDITEIIRRAIDSIQHTTETRQHTFEVDAPDTLLIYADPVRIEQILMNLINNAVKYSPEGGTVTISIVQAGTGVHVSVKDQGIGIDTSKMHRLFGLFSQLDSSLFSSFAPGKEKVGLGIGLYISKILAEIHGGSLSAHSKGEGLGTTFTVSLPLLFAEIPTPEATDTSDIPTTEPKTRSTRIMLIDDIAELADAVGNLLSKMGYETRVGYSGKEALKIAKEYMPDVVMLDIDMPEMDGYQTLQKLKKMPELASTRFFAVSGYGQEHDLKRSTNNGFTAHLVKPLGARDLQKALES